MKKKVFRERYYPTENLEKMEDGITVYFQEKEEKPKRTRKTATKKTTKKKGE